jgi:hypothetical protein
MSKEFRLKRMQKAGEETVLDHLKNFDRFSCGRIMSASGEGRANAAEFYQRLLNDKYAESCQGIRLIRKRR